MEEYEYGLVRAFKEAHIDKDCLRQAKIRKDIADENVAM